MITFCVMSVMAWGQSATFDKSTTGTLKIKASGDLTNFTITDEVTRKQFTAAAVGSIFTADNEASKVAAGDLYNVGGTYYKSSTVYTDVTSTAVNVNASWNQSADYSNLYGPGNSGVSEVQKMNGYYTINLTEQIIEGTSYTYYFSLDSDGETKHYLTLDELKNTYLSSFTRTIWGDNQKYKSSDGVNFTLLAQGTQYTLEDNDKIYTASYNFSLIVDNATFFAGEGETYVEEVSTPLNMTFKEALLAEINAGSYTSVVFEQDGGAITIDPEIVQTILFPNNVQNGNIKKLDLGAATITSFDRAFEQATGDYTYNQSIQELTLPLVADGVVPANVIPSAYNDTKGSLNTVHVPAGYTKIGDQAFKDRSQLTTITLPEGITEIGVKAFANCVITTIELPNSLEQIDEAAFLGDVNLESVTYPGYTGDYDTAFPPHLKKIYKEAFSGCQELANFKFNTELEFIGNSAFYLNHIIGGQMPTLDFPSSLKYLGPGSFLNRNFAEVYFHGVEAPICPVGPYFDDNAAVEMDVAAFTAVTHMGNNGFTTNAASRGGENTASGYPYANRENYFKSDGNTYFTVLHFPAGITPTQAKTYKDITRKYETVENYADFVYNASYIDCGLESSQDGVMSFKDYNSTDAAWTSEAPLGKITAGHVDTYLGEQKIWPSQTQWMRAYTTVANGLEWNGVDTYRPVMNDAERAEMLSLMAEDGLKVWDPSTSQYLSISEENYTLNEAAANAYNATLSGAVHVGDAIDYLDTEEIVIAYNAGLTGAVTAGSHNYTEEQAKAHNAALPGAISTEDIKEPAVVGHEAVYYQDDEKEWVNGTQYIKSTLVWHDAVPATYWGEDEVWYNSGNNGTYKIEDKVELDGYYTAEYLASMMDSWEYTDNDTKFDEDGVTTLYYYKGTKVKAGATVVGWGAGSFEKSPAVAAHWEVTADSKVVPSDNIKEPAVESKDAVYYTQQDVDEYNADTARNPGAVSTSDTYTLTEEEAIAENAKLPGAKKLNDPWHVYDEASANAKNATLDGAKKDDGEGNYGSLAVTEAFEDYISKIAYQSTRRFVLADDGSNPGDSYDITLEGHNWWTIVFPFSMTKKEVEDVFGIGTHVCLFSGVDRGVGTDGTKQITLKFQNDVFVHNTPLTAYVTDGATGAHYANFSTLNAAPGDDDIVIKAFEAYMIRPTNGEHDAATFKIVNPKIEQGAPFPTVIKANTTIDNRNEAKFAGSDDHTEYRFVGNLLKQLVDASGNFVSNKIPQYSYMYAKKTGDTKYKFWFNTSKNITWAVNKCVVQATAKDGGYKDSQDYFGLNKPTQPTQPTQAKQISIFGDFYDEYNSEEEEATALQNVTIIAGEGEDAEVVYNLNGQIINPNALRNGIYVKNGKKVLVK